MRETNGLLTVHADTDGNVYVTSQGHLRVPAILRHRCGLHTGNRLLLVTDPTRGQLVIYPPATLDALLTPSCTGPKGGASA